MQISNSGLAKKHFHALNKNTPWKSSRHENRFVLLQAFMNEKRISFLEYAWTVHWLQNIPDATEEMALALCHILLAAKAGHLCVCINAGDLTPSIEALWNVIEDVPLPSNLSQMIIEGLQSLPKNLISEISYRSDSPSTPFCSHDNRFYIQRHWIAESSIIINLERLQLTSPVVKANPDLIEKAISHLRLEGLLNESQALAVKQGCSSSVCLITGGPGTGKTYTAAYLLKVFLDALSGEQRVSLRIALASPTGKAAAQLQRSISHLVSYPTPPAKTLHSLLGIKSSSKANSIKPLDADLIIVDECSMIDAQLMATLLASVKVGARLILIGDARQLPSVEAGSIFSDLLRGGKIPCTHLEQCQRTKQESILEFAAAIHSGHADAAVACLNGNRPGLSSLPLSSNIQEARRNLWEHVKSHFHSHISEEIDPEAIFNAFLKFRILSPLRKGPFGTNELNDFIVSKVCSSSQDDGWLAFPIMITGNDYKLGLFNGENGLLIRKFPFGDGQDDFAWFPTESKRMPSLLLPAYEYAYCLSVHKSQGSEFNHVLLLLPEGSEAFGREILYTGVTRARERLEVVTTNDNLQRTISQKGDRKSGLQAHFLTN